MCLDQSFREHLPAAAATSLCRLLTLFGADALSRAALAACDAAPLALCVALYQCVSSSHPSPSTLRCDAVLRCGVDVRLFLLSRFKRLERNKQGRSLVYTMHSHALNPLLSREPTNPLHLSQSSPLWECF